MVLLVEGVARIVVEFRRLAASGQLLIRPRRCLAGGQRRALRLKATLPWRGERAGHAALGRRICDERT
jgi:hypothetical protein